MTQLERPAPRNGLTIGSVQYRKTFGPPRRSVSWSDRILSGLIMLGLGCSVLLALTLALLLLYISLELTLSIIRLIREALPR